MDVTPEPDLDRVAQIAAGIAEKLRDDDLRELHNELAGLCRWHPSKAAQLITCLAAWLDPDTPCSVLWARVESIAIQREQRAAS